MAGRASAPRFSSKRRGKNAHRKTLANRHAAGLAELDKT
jgi:hypothetical protein